MFASVPTHSSTLKQSTNDYKDESNEGNNNTLLLSTLLESSSIGPSAASGFSRTSNSSGGSTTACHSFPVRLYSMLDQMEKEGRSDIVSWQPHGRSLRVHKKEEFVQHVLPRWFRQSKFASFRRQLNLYGFQRISTGIDKGAYYHELFLRGKPVLCYRIQYIKVKGKGYRKPSFPETEPRFYSMPFLPHSATPTREQPTTVVEMAVDSHHETSHLPKSNNSNNSSCNNNNNNNCINGMDKMDLTKTQLPLPEYNGTTLDHLSLLELERHPTDYNEGEVGSSRNSVTKNKSLDEEIMELFCVCPSQERTTTTNDTQDVEQTGGTDNNNNNNNNNNNKHINEMDQTTAQLLLPEDSSRFLMLKTIGGDYCTVTETFPNPLSVLKLKQFPTNYN